MRKANKFGRGGCFKCCECGRQTRDAGDNGACEMCPECYERCTLENDVSDNGETAEKLAEIESWRAKAVAKGGVLPAPAPAPATVAPKDSRKQIELQIRLCETRVAEATVRLQRIIESITRESTNASQWVADGRGSVASFASTISMRAMDMAALTAEIEQHKAVRQSMLDMLDFAG